MQQSEINIHNTKSYYEMVPETALCWNHYHAFKWKCYSHWRHFENAAQIPAT